MAQNLFHAMSLNIIKYKATLYSGNLQELIPWRRTELCELTEGNLPYFTAHQCFLILNHLQEYVY